MTTKPDPDATVKEAIELLAHFQSRLGSRRENCESKPLWDRINDASTGLYALRAALARPLEVAGVTEAVAWRHNKTHGLYDDESDVPLGDGDEWAEPLYLHPPTASQAWKEGFQAGDDWRELVTGYYEAGNSGAPPETPDNPYLLDQFAASRAPVAVGVEPTCSEEGYLCYAYGEDSRVARLCHTREEVLQFMLREWFGDESPEKMHPDNRENWDTAVAEFDAPEWDLGDELVWELEQGGVTITKCCFYATPSAGAGGSVGAEPVAWILEHDGFTHYSGGRVPSQRILLFKKPSPEQERYYEGCETLKFTPLYTAHPLQAQDAAPVGSRPLDQSLQPGDKFVFSEAGVQGDAARLDWIERNLFERKWSGTIGFSSEYFIRGDYRHTTQKMRGETLRAAIDAARAQSTKGA